MSRAPVYAAGVVWLGLDPAGLGAQVGGGGGGARHHWRPHARGGARAGADGAVHGQWRCGHG